MKTKSIVILSVATVVLTFSGWLLWGCQSTDPFRAIEAERQKKLADARKMWETPITFYGKVVDEKGTPISGASVSFSITDTSRSGGSDYYRKSDAQGLFSLKGVKGYAVDVAATKDGYYDWGKGVRQSFLSSGGEKPLPTDPNNPAIFTLRKKGEAAALIYKGKTFNIPTEGTPYELDLKRGVAVSGGEGHIKMECWAGDLKTRPFDWRCRITVPDGGLVRVDPEELFPFEAPEDGYEPFDEINMPAALRDRWLSQVRKRYYLKLKDGNYAMFNIRVVLGGLKPFVETTWYLNPSGSRNLEYDKAKQINK